MSDDVLAETKLSNISPMQDQNVHCPTCSGTGRIARPEYDWYVYLVCLTCEGKGFVPHAVAAPIIVRQEKELAERNALIQKIQDEDAQRYRTLDRKIIVGALITAATIIVVILSCVTTGHC